jgi:hypothetical protein
VFWDVLFEKGIMREAIGRLVRLKEEGQVHSSLRLLNISILCNTFFEDIISFKETKVGRRLMGKKRRCCHYAHA